MGVSSFFSEGGGDFFRGHKFLKMHYYNIFLKKIKKGVKLLRVWTKNANCWEILRKFSKKFLKKIAKNALFWDIFKKNRINLVWAPSQSELI